MVFTEDELIRALEAARHEQTNAAGALTMRELQQKTGRGIATLRRELWALKEAGRLQVVRVKAPRIDGVMTGTVAYRIRQDDDATNGSD